MDHICTLQGVHKATSAIHSFFVVLCSLIKYCNGLLCRVLCEVQKAEWSNVHTLLTVSKLQLVPSWLVCIVSAAAAQKKL